MRRRAFNENHDSKKSGEENNGNLITTLLLYKAVTSCDKLTDRFLKRSTLKELSCLPFSFRYEDKGASEPSRESRASFLS